MAGYLSVIEEISKSKYLSTDEIKKFTKEVLVKSSKILECNRCNAWVFDDNQEILISLLSYTLSDDLIAEENPLLREHFPNYFEFLKEDKIIVSNNAVEEPMNSELLDGYIVPNKITSMIDVPLRSGGEMIGVICFEHVNKKHVWTEDEQKYTQSVAQLLSLAIEGSEKREYRVKLEKIISEKEVLIAEIDHRVKNNMAVIMSLLNLQKRKTKDSYHASLFEDINRKVYSMAIIQEHLHASKNVSNIDLGRYLENLAVNLNTTYGQGKNVKFKFDLDVIEVDVLKAIPCGLIANEVLTNSFKYAFTAQNKHPKLVISLKEVDAYAELILKDNGLGYDVDKLSSGMGIELIKGLANQISASFSVESKNGVVVVLRFPIACDS